MKHVLWLAVGLALAPAMVASAQPAAPAAPTARGKVVTRGKRGAKAPVAPVAPVPADALTGLVGTDLEGAARAAAVLGAHEAAAAHEALLDALALGLHPAVAPAVLAALAVHPGPLDVVTLARYARHATPSVRAAAVAALAAYPGAEAQTVVLAALRDTIAPVRAAAALAAGQGRIRAAVDPLMQLLTRGEEPAARGLALLADADLVKILVGQLGKVPEPTLAAALGGVLARPDVTEDIRLDAVRGLGTIQDPAALRALGDYVARAPTQPVRVSRQEAEMIVGARAGGGQ